MLIFPIFDFHSASWLQLFHFLFPFLLHDLKHAYNGTNCEVFFRIFILLRIVFHFGFVFDTFWSDFFVVLFGQTKGKHMALWNQNIWFIFFLIILKFSVERKATSSVITYCSQPRDIFLQMISLTNYSDASGLTVFNTCAFFFFHTHKKQCDCSSRPLSTGLFYGTPACDDLPESLTSRSRVSGLLCVTGMSSNLQLLLRFIKRPLLPDTDTA